MEVKQNLIKDMNYIIVFHGTTKGRYDLIIKDGYIKPFKNPICLTTYIKLAYTFAKVKANIDNDEVYIIGLKIPISDLNNYNLYYTIIRTHTPISINHYEIK